MDMYIYREAVDTLDEINCETDSGRKEYIQRQISLIKGLIYDYEKLERNNTYLQKSRDGLRMQHMILEKECEELREQIAKKDELLNKYQDDLHMGKGLELKKCCEVTE
ncbi:MAG: hypothetical protein ACOX1F_00965 [Erysipelotrichaceae bacterium]|jgi:hypothetical protein